MREVLEGAPEIDGQRIAYRGMSLGSMIGIPLVASEPSLRAATFGLAGLNPESGVFAGFADRLRVDAPRVQCPLLFMVQWDDETVPRDSAFALFDLFGASDKRMYVHVGRHADVPQGATEASTQFLVDRLLDDSSPNSSGGA